MQKKNVLMMTMSLAMVGVVAVGGTLAYLTSNTNTLTNTFTVGEGYGDDSFYLDETKRTDDENPTVVGVGEGNRTQDGNTYVAMSVGDALVKDPTFHLTDGPESYVFAKIDGLDAVIDAGFVVSDVVPEDGKYSEALVPGLNTTNWEKIADLDNDYDTEYDGFYIYKVTTGDYTVTPVENELERLFASISINSSATELPSLKRDINDTIKITGMAIQADNINGKDAAWAALKGENAASGFVVDAVELG